MKIYKYQNQTIWKYKFDYIFDPEDDADKVEDIEYIGTKDEFEEFKSCEELTYKAKFKNIKKKHVNFLEYRT